MKKRLFAALAAVVLATTLTACGDKAKEAADAAKASADSGGHCRQGSCGEGCGS